MTSDDCLLAWIERHDEDCFIGAYVGAGAGPNPLERYSGRAPVMRNHESSDAARQWVTREAAILQVHVRWVDKAPWRHEGQ